MEGTDQEVIDQYFALFDELIARPAQGGQTTETSISLTLTRTGLMLTPLTHLSKLKGITQLLNNFRQGSN